MADINQVQKKGIIDYNSESIETINDESQPRLNNTSDCGEMPSLIDDSQNVVPGSLDGNAISSYSESPEFLSNPIPPNVRKDLAIVSKLWGDGDDDIKADPSPKGIRAQDAEFTAVLTKSQKKKSKQRKRMEAKSDV